MTIVINKAGERFQHTSMYVPCDIYTEAKSLNIKFSSVLEEALSNKISEIHHANSNR